MIKFTHLKKMIPHASVTYTTQQINLKTYNSILKITIRTAKSMNYESTFNRRKHNIRKTWQTINEIISKSQKRNNYRQRLTTVNNN